MILRQSLLGIRVPVRLLVAVSLSGHLRVVWGIADCFDQSKTPIGCSGVAGLAGHRAWLLLEEYLSVNAKGRDSSVRDELTVC